MPKTFSGTKVLKILVSKFGFEHIKTKGSHAKLRKESCTVIIPLHTELKTGTFRNILRQAGIKIDDFLTGV